MAFTAPMTFTAGAILTAAQMNTYVRDNMKAVGGADKAACRVWCTGAQAVATATRTAILFDSETFDIQACHSTVTNTSRITAPTNWGGEYLIGGNLSYQVESGTTYRQTTLLANGSVILTTVSVPSSNTTGCETAPVTFYALAAGDYVEICAQHDKGSNTNVSGANFWANWQGTG